MKWFSFPLFLPFFLLAETPYGIVGTGDITYVDVFFIDSSGNLEPVSSLPTDLIMNGLAINRSGEAVFAGITSSQQAQAYLISPAGTASLVQNIANSNYNCVAINNSATALLAGRNTSTGAPFAQLISSSGSTQNVTGIPSTSTLFKSCALADNHQGLLLDGIGSLTLPAAYQISSSGVASTIANLPSSSNPGGGISITPTGLGAIAYNGTGVKTRYIVDGTAVLPAFPPSGFTIDSSSRVALNDSGKGIISGVTANLVTGVVCFFSLTGPRTQLAIPGSKYVSSLDLNNSSLAVVGGFDYEINDSYAYFISSDGTFTPISLPYTGYPIESVSINDDNIALLGGTNGANYLAFLASYSTGMVTSIPLSSPYTGNPFFVALTSSAPPSPTPSLYSIPTSNLSGNDLKLANYINSYAPSLTSYFIFSNLTQTLPQALQSVAPTRNSFALFSASNTVFSYNYVLSNHSRNNRASYRPFKEIGEEFVTAFFAKKAVPIEEESTPEIPFIEKPKPLFEMWGQFIGTFAYQKAEGQSPSYDPKTGGFVVGFDHKMEDWCLGIGSAYSYTHVSEGNAGKIHLNQESLFFYSLWNAHCFYIDTALWGGSFQTSSLRKIQMTGYQFQAKSDIWAWQLSPHLEVGYDRSSETKEITIEPYAMFDWVNNWQLRYKERGSGPFNMGQDNHYSSFLRTELGFRLYEQIDFAHWHLIIQEKGGFVNKKPFQVGTVNAYLIGFPGSFTVETFTTTQNLGVAELELLFVPTNPYFPYGTLSYQGEFGKMYQSHTASLNATWNF